MICVYRQALCNYNINYSLTGVQTAIIRFKAQEWVPVHLKSWGHVVRVSYVLTTYPSSRQEAILAGGIWLSEHPASGVGPRDVLERPTLPFYWSFLASAGPSNTTRSDFSRFVNKVCYINGGSLHFVRRI